MRKSFFRFIFAFYKKFVVFVFILNSLLDGNDLQILEICPTVRQLSC